MQRNELLWTELFLTGETLESNNALEKKQLILKKNKAYIYKPYRKY